MFNIQKFSVHDGPGIRTIIFLKGCSLRCDWCSNPESQSPRLQLAYNPAKCLGIDDCQRCLGLCPQDALTTGDDRKIVRDAAACDDCLLCAEACPTHALNTYGYQVTVDQALGRVEEDEAFYARSGGGVTLSGGEPLFQPEFAIALLSQAKQRHVDTCIETCGNVPWPVLQEAARHLDCIYFDLKSMDPAAHQAATGASNQLILENLAKLKDEFPELPVVVRTPVVPGFNDNQEAIAAMVDFIKDFPNTEYELLAYHRMGMPKYAYLGRDYPLADTETISQQRIDQLRAFAGSRLEQARGED